MRNYIFFLIIILISCARNSPTRISLTKEDTIITNQVDTARLVNDLESNLDSVRLKILQDNLKLNNSDTTVYEFSLDENLSAEGNEGKAFYVDYKIIKVNLTIYGEMGKSTYSYKFDHEKVDIEKEIFFYDAPLSGNMISTIKVTYQTTYSGELIKSDRKDVDLDTYFILKKSIPFTLK